MTMSKILQQKKTKSSDETTKTPMTSMTNEGAKKEKNATRRSIHFCGDWDVV